MKISISRSFAFFQVNADYLAFLYASRKTWFCYSWRNGEYHVLGVSEYCGIARGWLVLPTQVWQVPSSFAVSDVPPSGRCLPSSVVPNVSIHDSLLFLLQVWLVHLPSQHFLVPSTRQVVTSVVLHVMCWPWTTSGVAQPSFQSSSPKRAIQLLLLCTASRFQPNTELQSEAICKIMLQCLQVLHTLILLPWVRGKQRSYGTLLLAFLFFFSCSKEAKGVKYLLRIGQGTPLYHILFIHEVFILSLFQKLRSWINTKGSGFVNNVRYTGRHGICKTSQPLKDKEYERGATLWGNAAYSAWAGLNLWLVISHPDGQNPREFGDIYVKFWKKVVLKIQIQ